MNEGIITGELIDQEAEKKLILDAYRQLLRSIKTPLDDVDQRNIRQAFDLAVEAHSSQRRKSGEPYILHPIAVARICVEEIGLGPTAVICALLHDVVEDTEVTLEDIKAQFGDRVEKIVDGLTKLDDAYDTESPQAENFRKVLSTLVEDVRVVLIKMADRLHNMRTLGAMPRHKQLKIAAETTYIYAPLAHRLGLYNIKTEFQDLSMKITDPDAYKMVAEKLAATKRDREKYIEEFIAPLKSKIDEAGIPCHIFGRPKSIYSIWNKINTKNVPFESIYDLFAIRIIVDVPHEKEKLTCWQVYSIVTDVHIPLPERLKDWITVAKSNGYESLHTTVIGPQGRYVEVQIRTNRMDEIAERGYAAHWKYKGISNTAEVYERWLDSVREILDDPNVNAVQFLGDFKTNSLFQEEVMTYTPKGDLIVLPKGATALDFAFSIHTDIGYHCASVYVNNRLVPLGYKLQNGDQVEILTQKNQKPNESWLKLVITGKARAKIRSAMKEERRKRGELGKEALVRKFKNLRIDFDQNVEILIKHYNFSSKIDLFFSIAMEERSITALLKPFKVENGQLVEHELVKPTPLTHLLPNPAETTRRNGEKPRVLIDGAPAEQYEYSFANCCNPVHGDDIFAYLTANAGLKIHRTSCPNSVNLMAQFGYRVMKAEWVIGYESTFVAELLITGVDSGPGVIERLTHQISELGLNIRRMTIEGDEGVYEGRLQLLVRNTDQLNIAIKSLTKLENVNSVARVHKI